MSLVLMVLLQPVNISALVLRVHHGPAGDFAADNPGLYFRWRTLSPYPVAALPAARGFFV